MSPEQVQKWQERIAIERIKNAIPFKAERLAKARKIQEELEPELNRFLNEEFEAEEPQCF
jgi:hypothetical protein